jgi:hypothetical protein
VANERRSTRTACASYFRPAITRTAFKTAILVFDAAEAVRVPNLAAFEPSNKAVEFDVVIDTEFVLGSAAPHEHDLVLVHYSAHTSPDALRDAEAHISVIRTRLVQEHTSPGVGHQPPSTSASRHCNAMIRRPTGGGAASRKSFPGVCL